MNLKDGLTKKEIIVVGGPNGAGKTTLVEGFVAQYGYTYIGADAIAKEFAPDNPGFGTDLCRKGILAADQGTTHWLRQLYAAAG